MKLHLWVVLLSLSLPALIWSTQRSPVSAQEMNIQCRWTRADGEVMQDITRDAPETIRELDKGKLVETEYGQSVRIRCDVTVDPPQPAADLQLDTQLENPRWDVLRRDQGDPTPSLDKQLVVPRTSASIELDGIAPNDRLETELAGRSHQIYPKFEYVLVSFKFNSAAGSEFSNEFRATAAHSSTAQVELEIEEMAVGASELQMTVISRATAVLEQGFPEMAATILEDAKTIKLAEARSWYEIPWALALIGAAIGLVIGVLVGKLLPTGPGDPDPLSLIQGDLP